MCIKVPSPSDTHPSLRPDPSSAMPPKRAPKTSKAKSQPSAPASQAADSQPPLATHVSVVPAAPNPPPKQSAPGIPAASTASTTTRTGSLSPAASAATDADTLTASVPTMPTIQQVVDGSDSGGITSVTGSLLTDLGLDSLEELEGDCADGGTSVGSGDEDEIDNKEETREIFSYFECSTCLQFFFLLYG